MFTGIVEEKGRVISPAPRLRIGASKVLEGSELGDSIAVNGCCLTLVAKNRQAWEADVSDHTAAVTNLGDLGVEDSVNLERPMSLSDRLGGHLVLGHVDDCGTIVKIDPEKVVVELPIGLAKFVVVRGSICIDGISLTVAGIDRDQTDGSTKVSIALIPHTFNSTNLATRKAGDRVNIEVDMLAKHVAALVKPMLDTTGAESPTGESSQ